MNYRLVCRIDECALAWEAPLKVPLNLQLWDKIDSLGRFVRVSTRWDSLNAETLSQVYEETEGWSS